MPWSYPNNVPSCAKNWTAAEQRKCVQAANAVLKEQNDETKAIQACIHAAGRTKNPGGKKMSDTELASGDVIDGESLDKFRARLADALRAETGEWAYIRDIFDNRIVIYSSEEDGKLYKTEYGEQNGKFNFSPPVEVRQAYVEAEEGEELDGLLLAEGGDQNRKRGAQAVRANLRSMLVLDTGAGVPDEIPIHVLGKWKHPVYGDFEFTEEMMDQAIANFSGCTYRPNAPITAQVVVDEKHAGGEANGWLTGMFRREPFLMGKVDWTERGRQLVADKRYRFISPAYSEDYDGHGVTFKEITLTNRNFLKELPAIDQPVLLSEDVATFSFLTPVSSNHSDSAGQGGKDMGEKDKKEEVPPVEGTPESQVRPPKGQITLTEEELKALQDEAARAKAMEKRLAALEKEAKGREIEAAVKAAGERGVDAFTLNFAQSILLQLPREGSQDITLEVPEAGSRNVNMFQAVMHYLQNVPGTVPLGEKTHSLENKPPDGEEPVDQGKAKALAEMVSDASPSEEE